MYQRIFLVQSIFLYVYRCSFFVLGFRFLYFFFGDQEGMLPAGGAV